MSRGENVWVKIDQSNPGKQTPALCAWTQDQANAFSSARPAGRGSMDGWPASGEDGIVDRVPRGVVFCSATRC